MLYGQYGSCGGTWCSNLYASCRNDQNIHFQKCWKNLFFCVFFRGSSVWKIVTLTHWGAPFGRYPRYMVQFARKKLLWVSVSISCHVMTLWKLKIKQKIHIFWTYVFHISEWQGAPCKQLVAPLSNICLFKTKPLGYCHFLCVDFHISSKSNFFWKKNFYLWTNFAHKELS